ncbi:MAG: TldD/PmbA family protein [bacterium]
MLENAQLEKVLTVALQHGGDYADIYLEKKRINGIIGEENKIEKVLTGEEAGAGIRIVSGEKTSFAKTNDISLAGLLKAADIASRGVKADVFAQDIKLESLQKASFLVEKRPDELALSSKADWVKTANQAARSLDKRIKQVSVVYSDVEKQVTYANSFGEFKGEDRIKTRFSVSAIAKDEKQVQTGYDVIGGSIGLELYAKEDVAAVAASAGSKALNLLTAKEAPAGMMPIVISGTAGGTMIHEACGHGLEADLVQKGVSVYAGKKGEKVASSLVTVVDDGRMQGHYGSSLYDDEGAATRKNVLIKDGVLQGYLYDRITAGKDGAELTGNGRRESYSCRPLPRMTNTYIAKGSSEPEEIVRAADKGLFVKRMGGGQVNTATGDYVFDVSEGYLIEDGKVTCPVRGATLTGNGPETLKLVEMVGNDVGFTTGVCGKDGQGVPVTSGQPTILLKELLVGGSAIQGEIKRK